MQARTTFTVEVDPVVLGEILPASGRPCLPPGQLGLFEDLVRVSSDAERTIGGPALSFDGSSVSLTAGGVRLLLAQRLRLLIWSPLTITGSGTLEGFLELCQGRAVSREELSAAASRTREFIHTTLLYRFSRALSASEAEEFRRRVAGALELGRSRGHDFGEMEFREDHQVALVEGHLKWEDRELGATLLLAVAQFDLEVCPILGFKGTEFVNPLRAAT